jgi:hypothetical protein
LAIVRAIAGCGFVDGAGAPLPFRMAKGFQDAAARAGNRLAPVDNRSIVDDGRKLSERGA